MGRKSVIIITESYSAIVFTILEATSFTQPTSIGLAGLGRKSRWASMPVYISRVDLAGDYPVAIKTAFHRGRGRLLSLSERGVYIATDMRILPQATVRLQFELPDTVEAEAVMTWENQGNQPMDDLPPGYGMHLTKVPAETVRAIRTIMKTAVVAPAPNSLADGESSFTIAPPSHSRPTKAR